ncbi:protoporphyrinogen/coproporphyrinogen oxidase [Caballeronia ptereochthonis]|uniref:FAD dependent oxidoreductase n=1 Tax=Caballeronia ptereochthonis TaxID=1777144 RepID=A0A158CBK7_9BURK|nr:FAD-dependent oxidoreductase [Caballeronia ptereochthonis]SAK79689.1 FAD dependent oxidoreductase [Caballeronia ptereochthonis]
MSHSLSDRHVAVVGAGIAGLTAAYRLQQAGVRVTVFDAQPVVGGRMGDRREGDLVFNSGARLVYPFGQAFNRLVEELSLGDALVPLHRLSAQCIAPGGAHTIELMPSPRSLATPGLAAGERLRLVTHALSMRRLKPRVDPDWATSALDADPRLDRITLAEYIRETLGPNVLARMVEPVFRATRSFNPETLSALFYASTVPHMIGETTVHTLKGGMGRVCHALAAQLTVRTSTPVRTIRRGAVGDGVELTLANGERVHADYAVCAVEGSLAKALVEAPTSAERTMLDAVRYNALGVVHYGFALPLPPKMNFAMRGQPGRIATYQQLPAAPASGRPLNQIYCQLTPEAADEAVRRGLENELDVLVREELRARIPDFDRHVVAVANQWIPRKLPVFSPGYGARVANFWAWQEDRRQGGASAIVYCGDWLSQALLTGACASGERAAKTLVARMQSAVTRVSA